MQRYSAFVYIFILRIVSVDDSVDFSSFSIYYKATPQWTCSDFTSVQGAVASFQKINSYYTGISLGYFAQGRWLFEIEARLPSDETTVVFSGSAELYISTSNRNVVIPFWALQQLKELYPLLFQLLLSVKMMCSGLIILVRLLAQ